jgi:FdhD protein
MKPMDAPLLPAPGTRALRVTAWGPGQARPQPDWLADEVPVALVFNGISHAVMLASPLDLEDFALGFGLTEGLLAQVDELLGVEVQAVAGGIEVRLEVAAACEWRLKQRRRTLAGRTGCGLCGTDSLAQLRRDLPALPAHTFPIDALARAIGALGAAQPTQQLTGASHAAAWCNAGGEVVLAREDIGRHNALDKLIGALVRARLDRGSGFVCITSRASFEMVQKTAMAGIGALAAVSAPTALAVDAARACGLALAGFVRGGGGVAYTFAERFGLPADGSSASPEH